MRLNKKIIEWTNFGTPYAMDGTIRRHIVFSNVIYLTLPIVYLVFILIDLKAFLEPGGIFKFDRLIVPIMIGLCFLFLMLNKAGFISVSRILFLISWLMLLHVVPIILHQSPPDYYFAFPAGIIFHSVLIHVSFSSRKEPVKFWMFIAANFVVMLYAPDILSANDPLPEIENVLRRDPYYSVVILLYWLLFNLLMFYVLFVVEYYIKEMNIARALISRQHGELEEKNEELEQAVASLRQINQQVEDWNRSLESKVSERTMQLQKKNEKLIEYAHLNAHLLRGPFCRVKGLIMLKQILSNPSAEEEEEIHERLMQSLAELEEMTQIIQESVEINEQSDKELP